jgi:hypothetical protein
MSAEDPRREFLNMLGLYSEELVVKMNRDFCTIIDSYIAKGNFKLVQVFSQHIQKVKDTENAYEIMMCVLHQLADKRKLLTIFDWFLTQTTDSSYLVSNPSHNLNIFIKFKTQDPYDLERYEPSQFAMNLHQRASIREVVSWAQTKQWEVPTDQKSQANIDQGIIDNRVAALLNFLSTLRIEDR